MKSERELRLERRLEDVIVEREKAIKKMEDYKKALSLIAIDYVLDGTSWAGRIATKALGRPVKSEKKRDG